MDLYDIVMTWSTPVAGDVAQCTFSVGSDTLLLDPLAVAGEVFAAWVGDSATYLNEEVSADFNLQSVRAELYETGTGPTGAAATQIVNAPGEQAGAAAPANCTFLMRKQTGLSFSGTLFTGRLYMPGVYESAVDSAGRLSSGVYGGLITRGQNFLTDLAARDVAMRLHSQNYVVDAAVIALGPAPVIGTQRRRLRV